MAGMNVNTGRALDDVPHIWQSVRDILTTRIGTRVQRRDYGSMVPALLDHPMNEATRLRLRAATVMALMRWEPRIRITSVDMAVGYDGKTNLTIEAERTQGPRTGQTFSLNGVL